MPGGAVTARRGKWRAPPACEYRNGPPPRRQAARERRRPSTTPCADRAFAFPQGRRHARALARDGSRGPHAVLARARSPRTAAWQTAASVADSINHTSAAITKGSMIPSYARSRSFGLRTTPHRAAEQLRNLVRRARARCDAVERSVASRSRCAVGCGGCAVAGVRACVHGRIRSRTAAVATGVDLALRPRGDRHRRGDGHRARHRATPARGWGQRRDRRSRRDRRARGGTFARA